MRTVDDVGPKPTMAIGQRSGQSKMKGGEDDMWAHDTSDK